MLKKLQKSAIFCLCILSMGCTTMLYNWLEPDEKFSENPGSAPDYSLATSWAALPDTKDTADAVPVGEEDLQSQAEVDVFFIHPTTYLRGASWNQDIADIEVNEKTDQLPILYQASVFNSVGRIFAPRYRQAVLFSFFAREDRLLEADAALSLAYDDVSKAFAYYLEHYNEGRPIIIAAHSQGSFHGLQLLQQHFSHKPLRQRLVAAYLIGMTFPVDLLTETIPDIPLCQSAEQTGCVIIWNTWLEGAEPRYRSFPRQYFRGLRFLTGKPFACVNPLSWQTDEALVEKNSHLGAVLFANTPETESQLISAQCQDGILYISQPPWKYRQFGGNYHRLDYSLFYIDIRRNAEARAAAFLSARRR